MEKQKKGRLFGKLNIVDLVIIALLIVVALIALLKLGGGSSEAGAEGCKLTYTVRVDAVDPQVYENICAHIPGQLMASGKLLPAQVTAVTSRPHEGQKLSLDLRTEKVSVEEGDGLLDLVFTIEATVPDRITNEVGTQEVRIGKPHIVKTTDFELESGIIIDCQWEE